MEDGVYITKEEFAKIINKVSEDIMENPKLEDSKCGSFMFILSGIAFSAKVRDEIFKEKKE